VSDVATVVADVRERGHAAVADWSERFDGVEPGLAEPDGDLPEEAVVALADAVRRWHELQRPQDLVEEILPGVVLERRWMPLASIGIYVPRRLVSTLVMCAVPAQVAGVERIAVATPPEGAGIVARAAELLGLSEVWALGGPQAIAALAYGTETIAPVDKIVGPGNAFVNEAKLLVAHDVAVDVPAGPSEVVVLVSSGADLDVAELELAAQREHGPDSVCLLVEADGDVESALARVEALAPEHLVLLGEEAERLAPRVRNAGAVFVGRWSAVAAGDYATGGNHVLPTGGRAHAAGGLGLESFLKPVTIQRLTEEGLAGVRPVVEALAALEGMPAHAEAVRR
jgi:histidinol dehydrogenase